MITTDSIWADKKPVDKLFDAYTKYLQIEEDVHELVMIALDIDPDQPDLWPHEDFSHDYYDYSFELHKVTLTWKPTEEQLDKCWELGFHRCWINYIDGEERYFYKDKKSLP